jgi:hypothetical protein
VLCALEEVQGMLERGELKHFQKDYQLDRGQIYLDMSYWRASGTCVIVSCIGGWCDAILEAKGHETAEHDCSQELFKLFYPDESAGYPDGLKYRDITPAQAARAIDNFRSTGHSRWGEVLSGAAA